MPNIIHISSLDKESRPDIFMAASFIITLKRDKIKILSATYVALRFVFRKPPFMFKFLIICL